MSSTIKGLVLLSALALVACEGGTAAMDSGAADTGTGGPDAGDCTITGLTIESDQSGTADADGLFFTARSVVGVPYDQVVIDLDYTAGADDGVHTFTFTGENYDTCSTCLTIDAECDAADLCGQFLAVSGALDVTGNGGAGGTFSAELNDLRLIEVEIDAITFTSTPVVDGDIWCIEFLDLSGALNAP